jgi:hypothetical protein
MLLCPRRTNFSTDAVSFCCIRQHVNAHYGQSECKYLTKISNRSQLTQHYSQSSEDEEIPMILSPHVKSILVVLENYKLELSLVFPRIQSLTRKALKKNKEQSDNIFQKCKVLIYNFGGCLVN